MKNKHGSTHSQTTLLIPMDASLSHSSSYIWNGFIRIFLSYLLMPLLKKNAFLPVHIHTHDLTFDVLMRLVNNWIFILFPRFPEPLFALPYCHQFLAPIKTILSWHHKITVFLPVNFHKVFWDKTSADNFWTFVYSGPTVLRYLSVNPNHQKTWHVHCSANLYNVQML